MRDDWPPVLGALAVALVLTVTACIFYFTRASGIDFLLFHGEGYAWRMGQPLYEGIRHLNLNTPALTVLVFAPLSYLPYPVALWVWFVLSLAGCLGSLRLVVRTLRLSRYQSALMVAGVLLLHGSFQAWAIGQLTWPLLTYPVTRAWVAYRDGAHLTAGLWMAPAIVFKPPLALAALLLPMAVWLPAGLLSAAVTAATIPLTGLEPWIRWFEVIRAVDWLASPFNLSLWGFAARWQDAGALGRSLSELPMPAIACVLLGLGVLGAWTLRQTQPDRRYLFAGLFSTLASPLGWGYYLPLVVGPAVALWPRSWLAWTGLLLLCLPVGVTAVHPAIGSLGLLGVLLVWMAVA